MTQYPAQLKAIEAHIRRRLTRDDHQPAKEEKRTYSPNYFKRGITKIRTLKEQYTQTAVLGKFLMKEQ